MNNIKKVWRGNLPLSMTFWAFGVGGYIALVVLMLAPLVIVNVLGYALSLAYVIFIPVAIWRSAGKYDGSRLWPVLAKLVAALQLLGFLIGDYPG